LLLPLAALLLLLGNGGGAGGDDGGEEVEEPEKRRALARRAAEERAAAAAVEVEEVPRQSDTNVAIDICLFPALSLSGKKAILLYPCRERLKIVCLTFACAVRDCKRVETALEQGN